MLGLATEAVRPAEIDRDREPYVEHHEVAQLE